MKERIDPLIAERAPWLGRHGTAPRIARHLLNRMLGYDRTLALAETLEPLDTPQIMAGVAGLIARDVTATGFDNLPRNGPVLIVSNHPTGIADGIVVHALIAPLRPDLFIYTNRDILRVFPQMADLIVPVEWRKELRSHAKTRATLDQTRAALEAGRAGVIFPSGRLAKRTGLRLMERPWMTSAAMLSRKFDVPVVPLHIRARNSAVFYLFDLIHPTLRDITLFHETLNKDRQPFDVTMGRPIPPARLPANAAEATEVLRRETLALGERQLPGVSLVETSRIVRRLRAVRLLA